MLLWQFEQFWCLMSLNRPTIWKKYEKEQNTNIWHFQTCGTKSNLESDSIKPIFWELISTIFTKHPTKTEKGSSSLFYQEQIAYKWKLSLIGPIRSLNKWPVGRFNHNCIFRVRLYHHMVDSSMPTKMKKLLTVFEKSRCKWNIDDDRHRY